MDLFAAHHFFLCCLAFLLYPLKGLPSFLPVTEDHFCPDQVLSKHTATYSSDLCLCNSHVITEGIYSPLAVHGLQSTFTYMISFSCMITYMGYS